MANEKRLIDANALLKEIDGIHQRHYANSSYQFIHDFFLAMFRRIKNAPTVEAVEVVRCKDCKHYGWEQEPCHGRTQRFCKLHKGLVVVYRDTFCSYGERRNDGKES